MGSAKAKKPKEKRDKERRKHGAMPGAGIVAAAAAAAAVGGDGGGALSAAAREENGEVKLLLQKGEGGAPKLGGEVAVGVPLLQGRALGRGGEPPASRETPYYWGGGLLFGGSPLGGGGQPPAFGEPPCLCVGAH